MNEKRFNVMKSTFVENGWFISDKFRKFTFLTTDDKKSLLAYCKALNKLENELTKTSIDYNGLGLEYEGLVAENKELKQLLEEIKGKIKCADGLFAFDPKFYFGQIGTYEVFDYDISELNFKDLIKQIDEVLEND